jgi:GTPase SAR1 family protein
MKFVIIALLVFFGVIIWLLIRKNKKTKDSHSEIGNINKSPESFHKKANKTEVVDAPPREIKIEDILKALSAALQRITNYKEEINLILSNVNALLETCNSPLLVTILGEFSSGKSTFINSLLKEKLLAMKDVETTATITILQYGQNRKVKLRFNDGSEKNFDYKNIQTELDKYTVENFLNNSELDDIKLVSISLDKDILKNIDIADTPGYGSDLNRHTETTKNFSKYSDAIIWLFNAQQFGKATEIKLLSENCKHFRPIAIVNKIDQTPLKEGECYETKFAAKISKFEGLFEKIFFVSSYNALEGLNGSYPPESGMQDVVNYFNLEIIPKANQRKADAVINKVIGIGDELSKVYNKLTEDIKSKNEKLNVHNKKIKLYEQDLKEYNRTIVLWNKDLDSKDVLYLIRNIKNYFMNYHPPKNIADRALQFKNDYDNIQKDFREIEGRYYTLQQLLLNLNAEFSRWENEYKEYSNKMFGLKELWDDITGDSTEEKKKLNRMGTTYEKNRLAYNEEVDRYNRFRESTIRKEENWNESSLYFINNTVLDELNKVKLQLDIRQVALNKEAVEINELQVLLKNEMNSLKVFEDEIKFIFNLVPGLVIKGIDAKHASSYNDFQSMVNHLNSLKKSEVIDWERIYTQGRIENLQKKSAGNKNKLTEQTSKVASSDHRKTIKV